MLSFRGDLELIEEMFAVSSVAVEESRLITGLLKARCE